MRSTRAMVARTGIFRSARFAAMDDQTKPSSFKSRSSERITAYPFLLNLRPHVPTGG
jgi:hypothetical protein